MPRGTIIFLNGSSSAGKTTLAHALQEVLPAPYLHIALDQFRDGLPDRFRGLNAPDGTDGSEGLNVVPVSDAITEVRFGSMGQRMLRGMRRAIVAMVAEGNNVLIDDIILDPAFLDDYLEVFSRERAYFIGVRCPADVVAARESKRPGRFPGTAVGHLEVCHAHGVYDVEVDTHALTPAACARKVALHVSREQPRAFRELAGRRRGQPAQQ